MYIIKKSIKGYSNKILLTLVSDSLERAIEFVNKQAPNSKLIQDDRTGIFIEYEGLIIDELGHKIETLIWHIYQVMTLEEYDE